MLASWGRPAADPARRHLRGHHWPLPARGHHRKCLPSYPFAVRATSTQAQTKGIPMLRHKLAPMSAALPAHEHLVWRGPAERSFVASLHTSVRKCPRERETARGSSTLVHDPPSTMAPPLQVATLAQVTVAGQRAPHVTRLRRVACGGCRRQTKPLDSPAQFCGLYLPALVQERIGP